MKKTIDIRKMVSDQGGARAVAEAIGVPRTAPYRWSRTRNVTLRTLERMLSAFPQIKIEKYVQESSEHESKSGERVS